MTQKKQKRSLKNVSLTRKYHMPYMGTSIFLSLSLLGIVYGLSLYRFLELAKSGAEAPFMAMFVISTILTILMGILIVGANILAAHRIAGVHIKLKNTFDQITADDLSGRLYFRKEDKLEELQDSFNAMMDRIDNKSGAGESKES